MIVSFPDNANIQIFVGPLGTAPIGAGPGTSELLLPPPAVLAPKRSRRRDVLFLCAGMLLCVGVLMVVQGQHSGNGRGPGAVPVARMTSGPDQPSDDAVHLVAPASVTRPIPSAPVSSADADPTTTVRRLLAVPPTVTPPPGSMAPAVAPAAAASVPAGTPTDTSKRNSFGMRD